MAIILIISLTLPIILYTGTVDPFAPIHIVPIIEINHLGHESVDALDTPAFYTFGSILSLVSNIAPENLLFIPIQLITLILVMFILFRKISGSSLVASLIVIIMASIDVTGDKFFFWVHGMGLILFFLIIFLLANQMKENKAGYLVMVFISIVTLVYTSYDLTFQIILFIIALVLLLMFNKKILSQKSDVHSRQISQLTNIVIILLIFQLALSDFVYKTLIPQFQAIGNNNPFDNFLSSFLSANNSNLVIIITYPQIISILGIFKYLIIALFIFGALLFIIIKLKNSRGLGGDINIIFLSIFIAISAYMVAKFVIGQFAIGTLFIIGIFAIAVVYKNYNNKKIRIMTLIALIAIFAINLSTFAVYNTNGLINADDNNFNYISYTANWYFDYSNGFLKSDVLTNSFFYLYGSENNFYYGKNIYDYIGTLSAYKDIYPLIQLPSPEKTKKQGYYILNNKLNSLELDEWTIVKPWSEYEKNIDNNTNYNKIYDSKDISIFY